MSSFRTAIANFGIAGLLLATTACSGMSGAPGGFASGTDGTLGSGNSLDGNPASDVASAQGQTVPSTQESQSGIGIDGLCHPNFVVTVRVVQGGATLSCPSDATHSEGGEPANAYFLDAGTTAAEGAPASVPRVTFISQYREGAEEKVLKLPTQCRSDGLWHTQLGDIRLDFAAKDCVPFRVESSARWEIDGEPHLSNTFAGPPLPAATLSPPAIPIFLTINLGFKDLLVPELENFTQ